MTPYYEQDGVTIYHGDCREIVDLSADLVLSDPPYNINWKPRVNHQDQQWVDDQPFDPRPWLLIGCEHVFWGANYYASLLPDSPDWLTWIKRPIDFDFSSDRRSYATTEMAWTDLGCRSRFMCHVWDGGMRAGHIDNRGFLHPAQKPLELMAWCLSFSKTRGIVLDPFMGSGTTLVAAKRLGRKAIGIELNEAYCEIAAKRLQQGALPLEFSA